MRKKIALQGGVVPQGGLQGGVVPMGDWGECRARKKKVPEKISFFLALIEL